MAPLMTTPERSKKQNPASTKTQIRDASVLILVDTNAPEPRLLMGKRNRNLVFMPGKYIFPGGRVDPEDFRLQIQGSLPAIEADRLMQHTESFNQTEEVHALPLAAIRETFEETGILIGKKGDHPEKETAPDSWSLFLEHNVIPELTGMKFCARAITPEKNIRRYDTRFFCIEASNIAKTTPFNPGELDNIEWLTLTEASAIDLPRITRVILNDVLEGIRKETLFETQSSVPFYYTENGRFHREIID